MHRTSFAGLAAIVSFAAITAACSGGDEAPGSNAASGGAASPAFLHLDEA